LLYVTMHTLTSGRSYFCSVLPPSWSLPNRALLREHCLQTLRNAQD
jgi:hypothetical protein